MPAALRIVIVIDAEELLTLQDKLSNLPETKQKQGSNTTEN